EGHRRDPGPYRAHRLRADADQPLQDRGRGPFREGRRCGGDTALPCTNRGAHSQSRGPTPGQGRPARGQRRRVASKGRGRQALFPLPPPGGWVMTPDNVTLIVSLPEQAQLVYFDTVASKEMKRVDLDFQPGALALQGTTLFAAARGASLVYALELESGKVKKEF